MNIKKVFSSVVMAMTMTILINRKSHSTFLLLDSVWLVQ